jgi:hypothetical protein
VPGLQVKEELQVLGEAAGMGDGSQYLETSINLLMIHNFWDTIPYLGEIILIIPCSGELDHLGGEVYHV